MAALLATATVTGALAGLATSAFIWLVQEGTKLVWTDLPEHFDVDPFWSWWLFAVPLVGALLVGLTQRTIGPYPMPLEQAIATWRRGESLPASAAPRTFVNSLIVLVMGGPVGFEAALTGIIGGSASWISGRVGAAGRLVRQAWGAERVEGLPHALRTLPYWLAAVAGLVAYRSSPFGGIDLGFRYAAFTDELGGAEVAVAIAASAVLVVPVAWAFSVVSRAEVAPWSSRRPELTALAGALVFVLMALGSQYVLFSGQQAIQHLDGLGTGTLVYLTFAKWAALVVALAAGWRGGPIFPMYVAAASTAVLIAHATDVRTDVVVVAALAGLGVVVLKGNIPAALVLTLYVAPISYAGVILIGAIAGAAALAVARSAGILPPVPDEEAPGDPGGAEDGAAAASS